MRNSGKLVPLVVAALARAVASAPTPLEYFKDNWRPDRAACRNIVRIGSDGDGGKHTCRRDPGPGPCLVYSVGSNNDFSFEIGVHERYPDCEIHTFDPTVWNPQNPDFVTFHRSTVPQSPPEGGIFMLKMDCEGCEYTDLLGLAPAAEQIFVEVHPCLTRSIEKDKILLQGLAASHTLFSREHNVLGVRPGCMELSWIKKG